MNVSLKSNLILVFLIYFMFSGLINCKKKGKDKCDIKVVAIEKVKFKLVPVEIPRPTYLPEKPLTNEDLKKAWRAFKYSAKDYENTIDVNKENYENKNYLDNEGLNSIQPSIQYQRSDLKNEFIKKQWNSDNDRVRKKLKIYQK